jgi:hypothetical protein
MDTHAGHCACVFTLNPNKRVLFRVFSLAFSGCSRSYLSGLKTTLIELYANQSTKSNKQLFGPEVFPAVSYIVGLRVAGTGLTGTAVDHVHQSFTHS